jgi:hypothetical protein
MSRLIHNELIPVGLPITYSPWYDEPVVLRVSMPRDHAVHAEMHCTILSESCTALRIQIGHRQQNISKKLILAVEEAAETAESRRPQ